MIKFSKSFKKFKIKSKIEPYVIKQLLYLNLINMRFYPAMTTFTDQYSLPNIFFDIGQL